MDTQNQAEHTSPLVSVVMPVYNCELYVASAMESVLNQSYRHIELIIINDGCTDKSPEIIRSYSDPRIRYYENPGNQGIVYSRNRGLEFATGKYTAIMDSDDLLHPEKISRQVQFFEENPGYGFCATYYRKIDQNGTKISDNRKPTNAVDARAHLILENFFCHSSLMFPTEVLQTYRFDPEYTMAEDYELFYRISQQYPVMIIPEILTYYRVHAGNISTLKRGLMMQKIILLNRRILPEIKIPFTDADLQMHANFLYYNFSEFAPRASLDRLSDWVRKLIDNIRSSPRYNTPFNIEIILEKWMVACSNNRHYGRLIANPFLFRYPRIYLGILWNKVLRNLQKAKK